MAPPRFIGTPRMAYPPSLWQVFFTPPRYRGVMLSMLIFYPESHHACKRYLIAKKIYMFFLKATTFSKIGPTGCLILLDKFCPKVAYFKRGHFRSFSGKWLPIFGPKSVGILKLTVAYKKPCKSTNIPILDFTQT